MTIAVPGSNDARFGLGAAVVHPHHGAGVVMGRQRRVVAGELRDYLEVQIEHADMLVLVPEDAIDESAYAR